MEALQYRGSVDFLEPIAERWRAEARLSEFGLNAHWSKFKQTLQGFADSAMSALILLGHEGRAIGFMGAELFESPLDSQMVTRERFWYVLPRYRGRGPLKLRKAFLEWSKDMGASHYMMSASMLASAKHDRVCQIYEKKHMKKFETTYMGQIGD